YKSLESDFWAGIGTGEITATNALVKLIRLAQLTGGTLLTDDGKEVEVSSAKKALLDEVMEDMETEEPVVVFARFRKDLDRIAETAAKLGRKSYELSGRRNELKLWQEDTTGSVLAVQEQAGGVGISLVRARYCIYYSVGYSLGDYEQSLARIHRPGQSRGVLYVHLLTEQSIDEAVYGALDARRDVVEAILEGRTKGEK
ncbi:MAG: SWF/SNF helicase family protein, partial [Bacteroidales bacterium]|nr:SWF/SNF helicase family protein [Bacteroidales bacterium]